MQLQLCECICLYNQIQKGQNKLTKNILMIEKTYEGHEIQIYSIKGSREFKDIQARLLFNLCETSIAF